MDRAFWQGCYDTGDTRFDLGGPTPALVDWLATATPGRAVVPGCGRGHDVIELARRGWDALGIDFAHTARGSSGRFIEADFFQVPPEPVDLWFEQTFYCALPPARRDEYALAASRWAKPGGTLFFVAFPADGREGGPPFAIDPAEIGPRFARWFELLSLLPPSRPSAPARAGKELVALLRRLP